MYVGVNAGLACLLIALEKHVIILHQFQGQKRSSRRRNICRFLHSVFFFLESLCAASLLVGQACSPAEPYDGGLGQPCAPA